MRLLALLLPVLQLASAAGPLRPRDYDNREYYAIELTPGADHELVARDLNLTYEGPIGALDHHHLFSAAKSDQDVVEQFRKRSLDGRDTEGHGTRASIVYAEKQRTKKLHKRIPPRINGNPWAVEERASKEFQRQAVMRQNELMGTLGIRDPIFVDQWHLMNTVQQGHDVNVTGLWLEGITGKGSTVAIVDDGLDMYSNDLKDNYFAKGSYDFNDHTSEPRPRLSDDRHGTRCAGEVAAVKNDVCGVGVAWDAKVAGIRILSKIISDADEAIALNYAYQENHIYSCSWGPPDDGRAMEAPGLLIKKAIMKGIQDGRGGKGSVFVFASGNGASSDDNCNFDGYTNSIYSITVGAIDRTGGHPFYAESCSAQMVVTYSSGGGDSIHTTDVGTNQCYSGHGGTSAAAPLAAGIFALVLSVRPELTWRDLQWLVWETAIPINTDDEDWKQTHVGKLYNHKYGYGKLDAYSIVHAAKKFKQVKPQAWYHSPVLEVHKGIPEGKGLKTTIQITKEDLQRANLERVEHVTVNMNAEHQRRGDMAVDLISPNGIVSNIATARSLDDSRDGYVNWDFMSVKHWGEDGIGNWTVIIKDTLPNGLTGSLLNWSISLWGESRDPSLAQPHPLPGETPTKNIEAHPLPSSAAPSSFRPSPSAPASSSSPAPPPPPPSPPASSTPPVAPTTTPAGTAPPPRPSGPPIVTTDSPCPTTLAPSPAGNSTTTADTPTSFLPSFLPTFGVSPATQAWIYGSGVVIAGFLGFIGVYLVRQRRRERERSRGMDYEFEALGDDDIDDDDEGGRARERPMAAAGGRRKARDLYDAFGESDDESGVFSGSEEDEEAREKYYDEERARGIDEGVRTGDREKLLGNNRG